MIDKLDLRIHRDAQFRKDVSDYIRGAPYQTYTTHVRPAVQCKHGDKQPKLEIFDVSKKTYSEIAELVGSVTDAPPACNTLVRN